VSCDKGCAWHRGGLLTNLGAPAGFRRDGCHAGEFVFVNHAFGHGQRGAIGDLVVDRL